MSSDVRARLEAVVASLRATDAAREEQMAERDRLIRVARAEQVPWVEIQRLTGLTKQAVAKALKRGA